jgi:hypothetical protein
MNRKKTNKTNAILISIFTFLTIGLLNFPVPAQSTDKSRPTPIRSKMLKGLDSGQNTFYYSLRARRGSVVTVKAKIAFARGGNFSLDFRGFYGRDGGAKQCCRGDSYLFLDHGSSITRIIEKSFTAISDDRFYMILNYNSPSVGYTIEFDGIELDDEWEETGDDDDTETFTVPGKSGNKWINTGIRVERGDIVYLSATGEVDVSAGWGTHRAAGTLKYAPGRSYPVNSRTRYGLAARIQTKILVTPQQWSYGDSRRMTVARNGTLWLTVNDDAPDDNSGEFAVKVRVKRAR